LIFTYDKPDKYEISLGISRQAYSRKWVKCSECGFYYSISSETTSIGAIYGSLYRGKASPWRKESNEAIFDKVIKLPESESETKKRIKWIKCRVTSTWKEIYDITRSPPYRLLDIGGGTGVFAYEFQDSEWKSCIIDPDPSGAFLNEKHGIEYIQRMYSPRLAPVPFDLFSLVFVLEHMEDPEDILKMIRAEMNDESLIYIEVPDSVAFRHKPPEDDIFNSCHLWFFTALSISRLLDRCGMEIFHMKRTKTIRGHFSMMLIAGIK
jgi:ribosomal protein L37E